MFSTNDLQHWPTKLRIAGFLWINANPIINQTQREYDHTAYVEFLSLAADMADPDNYWVTRIKELATNLKNHSLAVPNSLNNPPFANAIENRA